MRPLYLPTLAGYVTARYRGGGARKHGRPFLLWRSHPTPTPTPTPNPDPTPNPNPNPNPNPKLTLTPTLTLTLTLTLILTLYLLWRSHHEMGRTLLAELGSAAPDVAIRSLDKAYPGGAGRGGYQFSDLARHPGARGGPPPTHPARPPSTPPIECSTHRMLHAPAIIAPSRLLPPP